MTGMMFLVPVNTFTSNVVQDITNNKKRNMDKILSFIRALYNIFIINIIALLYTILF